MATLPPAGGGPPNPKHLPLFTVLSAYADALDALPLDLTRSFSDLRELDAVLGSHLGSLTTRLESLAAALADPDMSPAQRLLVLKDCAEEARAYKEGGEDKIRVAVNTAETIASHTDFIDRLANGILAGTIPELAPALRPPSGRFLHHSRVPYDAERDRYMVDKVTPDDLQYSYNDVQEAITLLRRQAFANGELTGSAKSNQALQSRWSLNLAAGNAGSSFGMLGPSFHTHHGAGAAAAAATAAAVLNGPSAPGAGGSGTGPSGHVASGSGSGGAGAGASGSGGGSSQDRGGASSGHHGHGSGSGSSNKKGQTGAGGSTTGNKRSAAAAGLLVGGSGGPPDSRSNSAGAHQQHGANSAQTSGSSNAHSSSHRGGNSQSYPSSSSHAQGSHGDRHNGNNGAVVSSQPGGSSRSSHAGAQNSYGESGQGHGPHHTSRSHASNQQQQGSHSGSHGSHSGPSHSAALRESNKGSANGSTSTRQTSAAAAAAAAAAASNANNASQNEDQEDQTRYCYCQQVSYGEMIACDSRDCPYEWFHLVCANLTEAPPEGSKWYCEHCLEKRAKKKGKAGARRAR